MFVSVQTLARNFLFLGTSFEKPEDNVSVSHSQKNKNIGTNIMLKNKLAVSCNREIPNDTASVAKPVMSLRKLWAPSIDSFGALTSPKKAIIGSVIKLRLGSSLRYLLASFTKSGINIRKNIVANKTAIEKVIKTLNLSGIPIL